MLHRQINTEEELESRGVTLAPFARLLAVLGVEAGLLLHQLSQSRTILWVFPNLVHCLHSMHVKLQLSEGVPSAHGHLSVIFHWMVNCSQRCILEGQAWGATYIVIHLPLGDVLYEGPKQDDGCDGEMGRDLHFPVYSGAIVAVLAEEILLGVCEGIVIVSTQCAVGQNLICRGHLAKVICSCL